MASLEISNPVRMGAAGALGAVTLLWLGGMNAAFFQAGTVLLVVSLIPLARGLGTRGGSLVGLLLGVAWIAARLGFASSLDLPSLVNEVNVIVVAAMMTIGGLAGSLLEWAGSDSGGSNPGHLPESQNSVAALSRSIACSEFESTWREALARHREWTAGWDQASYPWTSFDNHVRELVRLLTGLQRLRCYRVSDSGQLYPLSNEHQTAPLNTSNDRLLAHVVTTGRRFIAGTPAAGPMVQELADAGTSPLVWAVPIRDQNVSIGLMTAEGAGGGGGSEGQLQIVADFVEGLWLHVHHLDLLRIARQTDRGSGLINRTDFLNSLKSTLEQCYQLNEPVVVMVVCLEGLRGLDDASHWAKRDELIEAVGQTIAKGIRKDDVVGRFSDAQFVALLRRLDLSLAELICRKLLGSMAKVISDFELGSWVTPRAGLSGSGFARPDAEILLRQAISALQRARTQDLLLVCEPMERPKAGGAA